ncbi:MAG: ATP-binding protein [Chloroflexi bacterium]|nr:ATP-binding protein [Chloroflexota bacterium]
MSAAPFVHVASVTLTRARRFLALLQWMLPLALFSLATGYEIFEHQIEVGKPLNLNLSMEVFLFGILGPGAVAGVIFYIQRLLDALGRAQVQLEALNRQLEQKVLERTVALEQRNAELARANVELQQLDEMKSEFVALVSHELRAPLTTLNGALELALQMDDPLPQPARATLGIMATESKRLTDFVQTILDLSRLEAGKLSINPGPVAVQPLLEQAAGVILAQSPRQVEWSLCEDLPPVWADEVLLEQVLRNLIRNADKYSPPARPILLSACVAAGNRIRISVRDHGAGISPEMQERVFERFVRGHSAESAPTGWGLGLYLGRKLVEVQNGQIGVASPAWQNQQAPGSEFYVLLPVADMPEDV